MPKEEDEEELAPSFPERPYVGFLFKTYTRAYESWVFGDPEGALRELLKLVVGTPTNIKEKLWDDKRKIEKDLMQAYRAAGVDWYTRQQNRNRQARRVADYHIEPFFDKITRLLDEKGWLERGAMRPRYPSKRRLTD